MNTDRLNKSTRLVQEFIAPSLVVGEQIDAILSFAETGSSLWLSVVRAPIGLLMPKYRARAQAIVVSDRRVLLVGLGGVPVVRPKTLDGSYARDEVRVNAFSQGPLSGSLSLQVPNETLHFNFRRHWRNEARSVVTALRRPDAATR